MTNADGDHEIDIEDLLNRLADSVEERKQQRADLASGLEFLARTVNSEARAHWSSARGSPLANDLAAPEVGERASPAALVRAEVSLLMASGVDHLCALARSVAAADTYLGGITLARGAFEATIRAH